MLSLEPVIRMGTGALPFDWASRDPSRDWIALGRETDDADIARIVAILAAENDAPAGASLVEACDWLGEASPFVADGGLIIRRGAFLLEPRCCAALSDWRGWVELRPGGLSPWWGHGPCGWVQAGETAAAIYEDGGDTNDPPAASAGVAHAVVQWREMDLAVARAREAMADFQRRLDAWLAAHAPDARTFAARFAEAHLAP